MTSTAQAPPSLPDKYEIIPVHASDIAAYTRCRRYWDWTSPARNNLRRKVQIYGINIPMWFGSGIHYALEMYYNPALKRDPVEAFQTWWQVQWYGGEVTEEWLERTYDIEPKHKPTENTYRIRGLIDLHPDPDHEEFEQLRDLGVGMMEYYKDYAERKDDFTVVSAESSFSVPLGFEATDIREQSPNYGKKLEVHARGKRDAIVYYPATERFGLIDHKTRERWDDDYRESLNNDPQCSTYIWASQHEAHTYDLPYKKIEQIVYQTLRKRYPMPPSTLKSGLPSLNRADESATAQMFADYIKENNLTVWFNGNEKAQAYYEFLLKEGDERFIVRTDVYRNQHEIAATGERITAIAKEMLADPTIYPNPRNDWLCTNCAFRGPCLSADDGSDWQGMLADGYERNKDR